MSVLVLVPETFAQSGVGESIIGIVIERAIEDRDGAINIFRLLVILKVTAAAEIEIVSGGLCGGVRRNQRAVLSGKFYVKQLEDAVHYAIFEGERIVHLSGDGAGAQLASGMRVDETEVHAHPFA